ncbi:hypothetical protein [Actinophytocola algeriensis]|uniref:Uncharacterized protein n=1 Tax=Actinophytocola algeriensis TaxID=1768010 RepID=A0A7W7Q9R2_9PSEU|nr:hypothetical protein [Actinophytocola algeriensis]MBB4909636.1 hypothetical protein [Actinophytocola algeriensis]MBE1475626.1 hypothetical protein [Actinophytocola algeriensis]
MSDHYPGPYRQPQQQQQPHLPVQSPRSPISQPIPQQYPQQFPQQFPQPFPQQWQPKQRARIVLLVACVVAFATAGVFGALYIGADSGHDAAVARLAERKSQLAEVRERLTTAAAAQDSAETRNSDLEAEKATLTTCVDAVQHYLWDGLEGTARDAAVDAMFTACQ